MALFLITSTNFTHNMQDSMGNPIPSAPFKYGPMTEEEVDKAITINTFRLAVEVALSDGNTVVYDADAKMATVNDRNGSSRFYFHL